MCSHATSRRKLRLLRRHLQAEDVTAIAIADQQQAISRLGLSARAYHRVLKLARTIADLAGAESIAASHVAEAVGYRRRLELAG